MGWLGTRLRKKPSDDEEIVEVLEPEPSGPPLVILVPEIAGGSSYRLHRFYDLEQAIEVIESTIPALRAGIHAFWAMQERPLDSTDADPKGEGMVLIRTNAESDTVYVVSFVDIESGESFARFEVKRGLDLGFVMIYWASHVEIDQTGAGFTLTPAEPPLTASSEPRPLREWTRPVVAASATAAAIETPELVEEPDLAAPEGTDTTPVADPPSLVAPNSASREALEAGERYRQDAADEAGMIEEEEFLEPPPLAGLAAAAAINGNGKNGHEPEATLDSAAPDVPVEADAPAETTAAFAGDEEIADRILQEALGDDPINLVSEAGHGTEAAVADDALPDMTARVVYPEPELDLFNAPKKTPRSRKKPPSPEADAEIASALTPDPETEASVVDVAAAKAAEKAIAGGPEPVVADVAPVAETPVVDESPVFTPAADVTGAPPVFIPAPEVAEEPTPVFTPVDGVQPASVESTATSESEDPDAVAQVEKILRIPRWEKKDDPFKGFNSPPGRF